MKRILFFAIISIMGILAISGCKKQKTYDIVFDANGGTGEMQSQTLTEGESQPLDDNSFDNEGRTFGGWNTLPDGSGVTYSNGQDITLTSNITLYAQWISGGQGSTSGVIPEPEPSIVTVTFKANGGCGEMAPQEFTTGMAQTLTANSFTWDGHEFIGWNVVQDGSGLAYTDGQEIVVEENITLYAQWLSFDGQQAGYYYVDLGLPSGTRWATCNIGANSPENCGDYFAWGEVSTKESYYWTSYQHSHGSAYCSITKYCPLGISGFGYEYGYACYTDNLTVLEPCDDAAVANWGEGWCMPTKEEMEELLNNCTNVWTSINGVNGRKFTGPNGNSIFMPAAGHYYDTMLLDGDTDGFYWTSSVYSDNANYSWVIRFSSSNCVVSHPHYRYSGHPVRPVMAK